MRSIAIYTRSLTARDHLFYIHRTEASVTPAGATFKLYINDAHRIYVYTMAIIHITRRVLFNINI